MITKVLEQPGEPCLVVCRGKGASFTYNRMLALICPNSIWGWRWSQTVDPYSMLRIARPRKNYCKRHQKVCRICSTSIGMAGREPGWGVFGFWFPFGTPENDQDNQQPGENQQRDQQANESGWVVPKRRFVSQIGLGIAYGDQRGVADRKTSLRWQVIKLLKNDGYSWLEFTEKRLRNRCKVLDNFIFWNDLLNNS